MVSFPSNKKTRNHSDVWRVVAAGFAPSGEQLTLDVTFRFDDRIHTFPGAQGSAIAWRWKERHTVSYLRFRVIEVSAIQNTHNDVI